MLQEKRTDLDAEKQKKLITRLVADLSRSSFDLYYQPTSEIARQLKAHIDAGEGLIAEEKDLLARLSLRDIEVLLSLH